MPRNSAREINNTMMAKTLKTHFLNMADVQVFFGLDEKPTCPKVVQKTGSRLVEKVSALMDPLIL